MAPDTCSPPLHLLLRLPGRRPRFGILLPGMLLAAALLTATPLPAQTPNLLPGAPADGTPAAEAAPAQQKEQRERLLKALAEARTERSSLPAATPQETEEQVRLLEGVIGRIISQLKLLDERDEVAQAKAAARQALQTWTGFSEKPPYSIFFVDRINSQVRNARTATRTLEAAGELFSQQVDTTQEALGSAQTQERRADEERERAASPEEQATAARHAYLARLRTRSAEAVVSWMILRRELLGERLSVARLDLELLERQLAEARRQMTFSRADLTRAQAELGASRTERERDMNAAMARNARSMSELSRIQQEVRDFTGRYGNDGLAPILAHRRSELEARQRVAQARVERSRFEVETNSALIYVNKSMGSFWEQRYEAVTGTAEQKRTALAAIAKRTGSLKPWLEYARQQLTTCQAAEREQEARLDGGGSLIGYEREILEARKQQRQQAERLKATLEQTDETLRSWQEEFELSSRSLTLFQRFQEMTARLAGTATTVWRFELFSVEDAVEVAGQKIVTRRGVTVGKSVGALLLLLVGYWVAAFAARRFQRIMIARFGIGAHQANVMRRWLLTLSIFALLLITLNLVRIPLTVFAFLGGALAIGVGFGTQTLIKNLISGIMILLERKVRVGDTVDVSGVVGRVTAVDIRASTVQGFDGVETVIPNSIFLENKVTNWTYSTSKLRRTIQVGTAYGAPTTRVLELLQSCAGSHDQVLDDPPPQAFFDDFGDSALLFSLNFWVDYGLGVSPQRVASDLRLMIERRFAEEGIDMPFPQRDVHLNGGQPLQVTLARADRSAGR